MPTSSQLRLRRRPSGGERVFECHGRLWSVAPWSGSEDALIFNSLSDARAESRALAVTAQMDLAAATERELRGWLAAAPSIGLLD
jgi:hypothetical protein